eukprot:TRINITY_DN31347_c0_g1_i3.p1 TRINITY_DN31347_c0_g1~~TRINITY_DN31347_c0_g1_i3.p1  ORF type:complete len:1514 (-),score=414.96 TRINITY_DN31347_c0_g1_i3:345-4886(-)
MGLDLSRLESPDGIGESLLWDADTLQRFLLYVKGDKEGSFRMTKWKLLEFTGADHLADVSSIFTLFEEGGETSVSSLKLAAGLVLFNRVVPMHFKVSKCLELFDWSGDGSLCFLDLLVMLQTCWKAVGALLPNAAVADISRDDWERLCREVMDGEAANIDSLQKGFKSSADVLAVLASLTPQDPQAATLAKERADAARKGQSPKKALDRAAQAAAALAAEAERFIGTPGAEGAQSRRSPSPELLKEARALSAGDDAAAVDSSSLTTTTKSAHARKSSPAEEPSLLGHNAASQGLTLQRGLGRALRAMQEQAEEAEQRWLEIGGATSSPSTGSFRVLERRWARAIGSELPTLPTMWTSRKSVAPFSTPASSYVMKLVLSDWAWLQHARALEEARFDTARVVAASAGNWATRSSEAMFAAADHLQRWMEIRQSQADDANALTASLEAELNEVEKNLIEAARTVAALTPTSERVVERLQRDVLRLEGAILYFDTIARRLRKAEQGVQEIAVQVGKARKLIGDVREEAFKHAEKLESLAAARRKYLEAAQVRKAILAVTRGGKQASPWAALQEQVQGLRAKARGEAGDAQEAELRGNSEAAKNDASALELAALRFRHIEGAVIAGRTMMRGGALRLEIFQHEAEDQLTSGARALATAAVLPRSSAAGALPDAAASTLRRKSADSIQQLYPWKRVLALEGIFGVLNGATKSGQGDHPVDGFTATLLEKATQRHFYMVSKEVTPAGDMQLGGPGITAASPDTGRRKDAAAFRSQPSMRSNPAEDAEKKDEEEEQEGKDAKGDKEEAGSAPAEEGEEEKEEEKEEEPSKSSVSAAMPSPPSGASAPAAVVEELDAETLAALRELRFEHRAWQVADMVVEALLQDGMPDYISSYFQTKLMQTAALLEARESELSVSAMRVAKSRKLCERLWDELLNRPGSLLPFQDGRPCSTVHSAYARARTALSEAYVLYFAPQLTHEAAGSQRLGATSSTEVPGFFSWQPQPNIPLNSLPQKPGPPKIAEDVDALGHAVTRRRRHAAQAVGLLHALKLISMMSGRRDSATKPGSGEQAGAQAARAAEAAQQDIKALGRCAQYSAEAHLLEALASQRMEAARTSMHQLLASVLQSAGDTGVGGALGYPPPAMRSPAQRVTEGTFSFTRAISEESHSPGAQDFTLEADNKAAELMEDCLLLEDVSAILELLIADPDLQGTSYEKVCRDLRQSCEEDLDPCGMGAMADSPAPVLPPITEWWGEEQGPLFLAQGQEPSAPCLELAELQWQALAAAALEGSCACAPTPPQELLNDYAAAFRIWALAQNRRLAVDAVAEKGWGCLIARQQLKMAELLVETTWRQELRKHQFGQLALLQKTTLQKAAEFVSPLEKSTSNYRYLVMEDFEGLEQSLKQEFQASLSIMSKHMLGEHKELLQSFGLHTAFMEGLIAGVADAQMSVQPLLQFGSLADRQFTQCETEVLQELQLSACSRGTRSRLAEDEKAVLESLGTLRGIERLRLLLHGPKKKTESSAF